MKSLVIRAVRVFDTIEEWWEGLEGQRVLGNAMVVAFLVSLFVIELRRQGLLPPGIAELVPFSHFAAVSFAFSLLLYTEVIGLVMRLSRSVSRAAGEQFEVFSLILLRESFEAFAGLEEPLNWPNIVATETLPKIASEVIGALVIFVILGFYYQSHRRRTITTDETEQRNFIRAKKLIALTLLAAFVGIGIGSIIGAFTGGEPRFFETFFTVLVFSDVLIVLISLRYSATYHVAFRNAGFAIGTVFIRLALIAPVYINAAIGAGAALYTLGLSLAYNHFVPEITEESKEEIEGAEIQDNAPQHRDEQEVTVGT